MADTVSVKNITLSGARKIVATATKEAEELGVGGAIAVVDTTGQLVLLERLDGTMSAASALAFGKATTAVAFKRPTKKLEDLIQSKRIAMLGLQGTIENTYVPLMGAYPIMDGQTIIGAVGIAGAETGENDEIIARAAAATPLDL
jgi:glc operon protein GlcG